MDCSCARWTRPNQSSQSSAEIGFPAEWEQRSTPPSAVHQAPKAAAQNATSTTGDTGAARRFSLSAASQFCSPIKIT